MKVFPASAQGKWALFLGALSVLFLFSQYWLALAFEISVPFPLGMLSLAVMLLSGALAVFAIVRKKERALFIFLPALAGAFGLVLVLGELFFPH